MPRNIAAEFARSRWDIAVLALILALYTALAVSASARQSVTFDEFAHLPAGLSYLRTGDFRLEAFNSPIVRAAAALPLWRDPGVKLPLAYGWQAANHWNFGYEFMDANAANYHRLFMRARYVIIGLGAATLILVFLWGKKLYSRTAALAAAFLLACDPTFMAHSGLVTGDVGAALAVLAAATAFYYMSVKRSWLRAALAGGALGIAILAKFSAVVLALFPPLLLAVPGRNQSPRAGRRAALTLLAAYLSAWLAIMAFFHAEGAGGRLGEFQFKSQSFRKLQSLLPAQLPVPLPRALAEGMDSTQSFNERPFRNYMRGQTYSGGKLHYFLYAYMVKTPVPALILVGAGAISLLLVRPRGRLEWLMVLFPAALIVFVSLTSNYNIGLRHLLPAYPFLALIAARPLAGRAPRRRLAAFLFVPCLLGAFAANLLAYPHYLSFFNRPAGGAEKGHLLLADSNLDWGQGLIELKAYLDENGIEEICFAYAGRVDPSVYGIRHRVPEEPEKCEVLVVSVQHLLGLGHAMVSGGRSHTFPREQFFHLQNRKPAAVIADSIWVFTPNPSAPPGPP